MEDLYAKIFLLFVNFWWVACLTCIHVSCQVIAADTQKKEHMLCRFDEEFDIHLPSTSTNPTSPVMSMTEVKRSGLVISEHYKVASGNIRLSNL